MKTAACVRREWNLNWPLRFAIVCCAAGYLLWTRPWDAPEPARAVGGYTAALIFVVLAVIPRGTRLWVAVCLAIFIPVLAGVVSNLFLLSR